MTIYDEDGDGFITKEELKEFALNKAKVEGRTAEADIVQLEQVLESIVAYIDTDGDGRLSRDELVRAINKDPSLKKVSRMRPPLLFCTLAFAHTFTLVCLFAFPRFEMPESNPCAQLFQVL
jgi:EF-hand domain pair